MTFFAFAADAVDADINGNGDDPVILFRNGTAVDTFGDVTADGTGTPWDYEDGWAYRKNIRFATTTFTPSDWDFSGPNALDGATSNATATPFFPLASYGTFATGGQFIINTGFSSNGSFSFGRATSSGTATRSITYTPLSGSPVTAVFSVSVSGGGGGTCTSGSFAGLGIEPAGFSFGGGGFPANAPPPAAATIAVSGVVGLIDTVNCPGPLVRVEITHDFPSDMTISLSSAMGTVVTLADADGGGSNPTQVDFNVIFDDAAPASIATFIAPSSGFESFSPRDPLSVLNGEDPNGSWTLSIVDNFASSLSTTGLGTFLRWDLAINTDTFVP